MKEYYKLKKENIIKQEDANEFMGIRILDGIPKVYVPLTFRVSEDEKQRNKDIILFLKSLSLAFNDKEYIKQSGNAQDDLWPIESYLWIIKDYLENGIYQNREKEYKNNSQGKIDWKRTIRNMPIYSNGNLVYTDFVSRLISSTDDVLSYTYKYCLSISAKRIGWLFNCFFNITIEKKLSLNEMITNVRKALSSTYDDIKRARFKHMLAILTNVDDKAVDSKEHTYGVKNYYYVFERMVDIYFNGICASEMKRYYPHGQWNIYPNLDISFASSELRPDTIKHIEKEYKYTYVIDAKMYKYGGLKHLNYPTEGLPETTSIQKQITYGDYIQRFIDVDRIVRNIFVLPFDKSLERFTECKGNVEYINDNIAFIGFARGDWRLTEANLKRKCEYEYIFSFVIDLNFLLKKYSNRIDDQAFDRINEKINKLINTHS